MPWVGGHPVLSPFVTPIASDWLGLTNLVVLRGVERELEFVA